MSGCLGLTGWNQIFGGIFKMSGCLAVWVWSVGTGFLVGFQVLAGFFSSLACYLRRFISAKFHSALLVGQRKNRNG